MPNATGLELISRWKHYISMGQACTPPSTLCCHSGMMLGTKDSVCINVIFFHATIVAVESNKYYIF
jgi:hypothetical protein